jgi:hypothetical protein
MIEKKNNSKHIFFFKKSNYDNLKKKKKLWKDEIGKGKKRRKSTQLDLT